MDRGAAGGSPGHGAAGQPSCASTVQALPLGDAAGSTFVAAQYARGLNTKPLGDAAGSTFVAAQYARGLNTNSLERNSFAVGVGRATEKVSFTGMAGYVLDYGFAASDELTLGANAAVHLLSDSNTPVQVSVQGGFGWASIDGVLNNTTILNFPIGVVL